MEVYGIWMRRRAPRRRKIAISAVAALTAWGVWDTWMPEREVSIAVCCGGVGKGRRTDFEMCRLIRRCCRNRLRCGRYISLKMGVSRRARRRKVLSSGTCQHFLFEKQEKEETYRSRLITSINCNNITITPIFACLQKFLSGGTSKFLEQNQPEKLQMETGSIPSTQQKLHIPPILSSHA